MQQGIAHYKRFTRYCGHYDRTSHSARHTRPSPLVLASNVAFVTASYAILQRETCPTLEVLPRTRPGRCPARPQGSWGKNAGSRT